MYQILQKFDMHWHDGGPSIAMMYHLRRVSDLLCNWKSCLLCYMKDVVLHCSIFFKWNKLVRVRVRVRVLMINIGYQVKTWQSQTLKSKEFVKTSNLKTLKYTLDMTHFLLLLANICKNEMDPVSIVEDTEQKRFCLQTDRCAYVPMDRQTDRQTRWNQYTPLSTSLNGGYNKSWFVHFDTE